MVLTLVAWLAIAAAQPPADEETNGWIAMSSEGRISIVYDREPDQTYTCAPDPILCGLYLELVDGLAPGERKRIATQGRQFEVEGNGDLALTDLPPRSPGIVPEPVQYTVTSGSFEYRCYRAEIGDRLEPGIHVLTLAATRRVQACLNGSGTAGAP